MGIAKIQLSMTHAALMVNEQGDEPAGWDANLVGAIFQGLPKNTTVVGFREDTYAGALVAMSYEILVYNSVFRQGSSITANFERKIGIGKTGDLVQFSVFTGLDLTDALNQIHEPVENIPALALNEGQNE